MSDDELDPKTFDLDEWLARQRTRSLAQPVAAALAPSLKLIA